MLLDDTDGELRFSGWGLYGYDVVGPVDLATAKGITLGSTAAQVLAAYPDTQFGQWPEPGCGDAWWAPFAFRTGPSPTGLRGDVDAGGEPWAPLDRALIDRGFPAGLDCEYDVMCAEVLGEFQRSVGLPYGCGLNRETWLALGLPLPADPAAPVRMLRAGALVTEC